MSVIVFGEQKNTVFKLILTTIWYHCFNPELSVNVVHLHLELFLSRLSIQYTCEIRGLSEFCLSPFFRSHLADAKIRFVALLNAIKLRLQWLSVRLLPD